MSASVTRLLKQLVQRVHKSTSWQLLSWQQLEHL